MGVAFFELHSTGLRGDDISLAGGAEHLDAVVDTADAIRTGAEQTLDQAAAATAHIQDVLARDRDEMLEQKIECLLVAPGRAVPAEIRARCQQTARAPSSGIDEAFGEMVPA